MGNILVFLFELVFMRTPSLLMGALGFGASAGLGYILSRRLMLGRAVRVLGIGAFALAIGAVAAYKAGNATFDSGDWRADGATHDRWPIAYSARERMVEDLVLNVLPGLTINEAKQILGTSDEPEESDRLSYVVGPHPIIDDAVLVLSFGKGGRFEKHEWRNN